MESGNEIVNRVATSALKVFDLEQYYVPGDRVVLDIKDQLYQGMILREKPFRDFIKGHDWSQYSGKFVAVTCSEDAIVPTWAYMLLASALQPFARVVVFGGLDELEEKIFFESLAKVDWQQFTDAKVVIKGCSKVAVPTAAYVEATRLIRPYAASIMYGEPCSTVPVYKKPRS
ncbi:MAG TPA: DUF2480 family protein [Chryseosolibacter sp.]|nr:DUF2480 family protein [Chryseosolibacter sp.]